MFFNNPLEEEVIKMLKILRRNKRSQLKKWLRKIMLVVGIKSRNITQTKGQMLQRKNWTQCVKRVIIEKQQPRRKNMSDDREAAAKEKKKKGEQNEKDDT